MASEEEEDRQSVARVMRQRARSSSCEVRALSSMKRAKREISV